MKKNIETIIQNNKVIVIVGINGSGKTRLIEKLANKNKNFALYDEGYPVSNADHTLEIVNSFLSDDVQIKNTLFFSKGEKRLLSIISFAIDNKGKTILLDDVERGLHPILQECLIDCLLDAGANQVIITTHSPGVVKNGWLSNVVDMKNLNPL